MSSRRSGLIWIIHLLAIMTDIAMAFSLKSNAAENTNIHTKQQVIVVGGGVGGLAIASRIKAALAEQVDVTILERNARLGGRCGSFIMEIPDPIGDDDDNKVLSFRHEHGPSLLLLPQIYEELFTDCNTTAEACGLSWNRCIPAYQCIFEDGDRILLGYPDGDETYRNAIQKSRRQMDTFEPDGSKRWDDYMRACEAFLDCGLPNFIEERLDLKSLPSFLREALRDFGKAWPLKPHSDVLDSIFQSDKMKALASFQDLYVGLEPFRNDKQAFGGIIGSTAPAVFGLLSAIELHPTNEKCGVFAPIGGFQAVTDAMETLARDLGVRIQCNSTVTNVSEEGVHFCSTGDSWTGRGFLPADVTVVNADLPYAAKCLVHTPVDGEHVETPRFDWIEKRGERELLFSSGVIAFHWCMDKALDDLSTHNVFMMAAGGRNEAEESWRVLRDPRAAFCGDGPFNFYVHRASRTDPTAAPENCDSILVLVPCQALKRELEYQDSHREEAIESYKTQFDNDLLQSVKSAVLKRLGAVKSLRDLEKHIVGEVIDTPAKYADQYNLAAGSPFGLSHGLGQLSLARPGPAFLPVPNTVTVGASSKPGNGVPLVMVGAKISSRLVIDRIRHSTQAQRSQ